MATKQNGSVIKSFQILDLFSPARREITALTVAQELAMTPSTAHRFLTTLVSVGALASHRRGVYCLGPKADDLGHRARTSNPLEPQVQPVLQVLCATLDQSVMACRFSAQGPVCMAVAAARHGVTVDLAVGTVLPFETTAQGQLWRDAGSMARRYVVNIGGYDPNLAAVAVPVRTPQETVLTLAAFGLKDRFDPAFVETAAARLQQAATELGDALM